jgi:hypothetical protein
VVVKPEYADSRKAVIVRDLKTAFRTTDFQIIKRNYHLYYQGSAVKLDLTMDIDLINSDNYFYPGSFDSSIPRKGGVFELVDESTRDMSSTAEAMALAEEVEKADPGKFGVYLETQRPTKNELEHAWVIDELAKYEGVSDKDKLYQRFDAMR